MLKALLVVGMSPVFALASIVLYLQIFTMYGKMQKIIIQRSLHYADLYLEIRVSGTNFETHEFHNLHINQFKIML